MFTKSSPEIYYEKIGTGKPLILLHGNKEDHTIFNKLTASLKNSFTVYSIDSRSHGKSSSTEELHYTDMADDVLRFIDELKLEKPCFYGFSDGGIIGLLCCIKRPDVFEKMIISGANITVNGLKPLIRFGSAISYFFTHDKRTKMMLSEPNITVSELKKIKCPTLVLAGEFDIICEKETRLIADSIPNSTLRIIKGKGHGDYVVNSDYLRGTITEYIL